jgi:diazepam-binding inhibitor (GABA receptor modulating acyl-CoA-binding protein)
MSTTKRFINSVKDVKNLSVTPTDEELLYLYKYYKQANEGPCNTSQPSIFSFRERAKWNAWNSLGNMFKEDAMFEYTEYVESLIEKYGLVPY